MTSWQAPVMTRTATEPRSNIAGMKECRKEDNGDHRKGHGGTYIELNQ